MELGTAEHLEASRMSAEKVRILHVLLDALYLRSPNQISDSDLCAAKDWLEIDIDKKFVSRLIRQDEETWKELVPSLLRHDVPGDIMEEFMTTPSTPVNWHGYAVSLTEKGIHWNQHADFQTAPGTGDFLSLLHVMRHYPIK